VRGGKQEKKIVKGTPAYERKRDEYVVFYVVVVAVVVVCCYIVQVRQSVT
jgi:hypothetical protein